MKALRSLLEDNSGGLSAARFQMLLWTIGVLVIWMFTAYKATTAPISIDLIPKADNPNVVYVQKKEVQLPAIPESVLILLIGITSAKVVQRFGEKGENEIQVEKKDKVK